ncbi:hypothetical protein Droror1_Dr00010584 [Drosera rotundifolia]
MLARVPWCAFQWPGARWFIFLMATRAGCCYKPTNKKDGDGQIPNNPHLPPQLICQLHNVTMHLDMETDEVYAQMTLQPLTTQEQEDMYLPVEIGIPSRVTKQLFL